MGNCSPPRVTTDAGAEAVGEEVEEVEEEEEEEVPDVSSVPTPVRYTEKVFALPPVD